MTLSLLEEVHTRYESSAAANRFPIRGHEQDIICSILTIAMDDNANDPRHMILTLHGVAPHKLHAEEGCAKIAHLERTRAHAKQQRCHTDKKIKSILDSRLVVQNDIQQ